MVTASPRFIWLSTSSARLYTVPGRVITAVSESASTDRLMVTLSNMASVYLPMVICQVRLYMVFPLIETSYRASLR